MLCFNDVQYMNYPYYVVAVLYTGTACESSEQTDHTQVQRLKEVMHFIFFVWLILSTHQHYCMGAITLEF